MGLGNSPNDLEMLKAVDIPVIVPGNKGIHPGLSGKGWQVAPGSQGWAEAVSSYQLSVISYQLSVISYQLSVISYQLSVSSYQEQGKMGKMRELGESV
ncbi:MAG: hypothetical protein RID09_18920 [Coleofasciculus sp. G1-WW12-02]